ncbi:MAG: threonylcarbamoyl-AMP synthase [Candidatus Omnitrophica bacterium]|nr:threonylcarbamoyl-AMP synthase [Candidatus Omnitrophota bacterium]
MGSLDTPRIFIISPSQPDARAIDEAAALLRAGGLVAFPTETVYGLGADAGNPKAIDRLNRVKGRPPEKPYSIHLHDAAQIREFVEVVPPIAQRLMDQFWPGPLTIVIPAKHGGTVGFRLPNHPVARAFLKACGRAVVAPSANRSGFPPPTDGQEVRAALDTQFDALLDAGPTSLGRESTVVSVTVDGVEVLREGAILAGTIEEAARS